MLIRPNFNVIQDVNDIKEFKKVKRNIIIYTHGKHLLNDHEICVINNSVQYGNCGGHLKNSEVLHTSNFYFGSIYNPFFPLAHSDNDKNSVRLNEDALIKFTNYTYFHKLSNSISEKEKTVTIFDGMFAGEELFYSNKKVILPSDPRFYNLDHQIVKTQQDSYFATLDKDGMTNIEEYLNAEEYLSFYKLSELYDSNTEISLNEIIFDSPYDLTQIPLYSLRNEHNAHLADFVNSLIMQLINSAMRDFLTRFTVIFDAELGYRLVDAYRFLHFDKYQINDENIEFASTIENIWESICDLDIDVRLTIKYTMSRTYVQVLPIKRKFIKEKNIKETSLNIKLLIEDAYNS